MSHLSTIVDLLQKAKELSGSYENVVLSEVNDHVVRISMMTEPYFWHLHPDSDEIFIGVEGTVLIYLTDDLVELGAGQMFTVPRGTKHRTAPRGSKSVNITIEKTNMTTVRVENE